MRGHFVEIGNPEAEWQSLAYSAAFESHIAKQVEWVLVDCGKPRLDDFRFHGYTAADRCHRCHRYFTNTRKSLSACRTNARMNCHRPRTAIKDFFGTGAERRCRTCYRVEIWEREGELPPDHRHTTVAHKMYNDPHCAAWQDELVGAQRRLSEKFAGKLGKPCQRCFRHQLNHNVELWKPSETEKYLESLRKSWERRYPPKSRMCRVVRGHREAAKEAPPRFRRRSDAEVAEVAEVATSRGQSFPQIGRSTDWTLVSVQLPGVMGRDAALDTTMCTDHYSIAAVILVMYQERAQATKLLGGRFIFETLKLPIWPSSADHLIKGDSQPTFDFVVRQTIIQILVKDYAADPLYRSQMSGDDVNRQHSTYRQLINALCDMLGIKDSARDHLLRQVQYHDPTRVISKSRLGHRLGDRQSPVPEFYDLVLLWAAGLGKLDRPLVNALAQETVRLPTWPSSADCVIEGDVHTHGPEDSIAVASWNGTEVPAKRQKLATPAPHHHHHNNNCDHDTESGDDSDDDDDDEDFTAYLALIDEILAEACSVTDEPGEADDSDANSDHEFDDGDSTLDTKPTDRKTRQKAFRLTPTMIWQLEREYPDRDPMSSVRPVTDASRICRENFTKLRSISPRTWAALQTWDPRKLAKVLLAAMPPEMIELGGTADITARDLLGAACKVSFHEKRIGVYMDVLDAVEPNKNPDTYVGSAGGQSGLSGRTKTYHRVYKTPRGKTYSGISPESHHGQVASGRKPHLLTLSLFDRLQPDANIPYQLAEGFQCLFWGTLQRHASS
ncbi:uncharacterized protein B0I36DRAFT_363580 [Microdochium trichocladiopsis]|uniref:Uncharacterized protein n=1 Tax=Microdochium trichocladiopsis TaxID=1682393 RepID=A0A9P9BPD8_9PEZI|nr:uncharacterized protein B0I36DRAFT_363580 [Microdochium trichocladiopsis]KAH7028975.1 hypothetical protein B0I36DRAFT_363580 [Microdochium trichocladiopsis]